MAVPFAPPLPRPLNRRAPLAPTSRPRPRSITLVPPAGISSDQLGSGAPDTSGWSADQVRRPGPAPAVHRLSVRARPSRAVYRRRRLALATVAVLAVLGAIRLSPGLSGGGPLAASGGPGSALPAAARSYVVQPGDTVWSIAHHFNPTGDERPLVEAITAELRGTALVPGQAIAIP